MQISQETLIVSIHEHIIHSINADTTRNFGRQEDRKGINQYRYTIKLMANIEEYSTISFHVVAIGHCTVNIQEERIVSNNADITRKFDFPYTRK